MGKDNVTYIHSGILINHKKAWDPVVLINMAGTGRHYMK
jgi:hypothetical protein